MPTPNFNFPDNVDDWTTSDVHQLDSTIASMLQHTHNGIADEMEELSEEPELTYNDDDGSLPPGVTYFYRVSLVDEHGRESLASDVATISIPAPVDEPGAPTATILETPGSLSSGTYLYSFSAWSGDPSQETMLGGTARVVVSPQHAPAQIRLDEPTRPAGADGWNLYRSRPGSADFVLLTTLDFTTHTDEFIIDTGLITENPNQVPSRVNTTRTVNSVEIEYPGGTVPAGFTWNVFRTEVDGYWENSLIWRVVEETAENSGIVTPVFMDTGYPQMGGQPVSATTLAPNPQRVLLTNGAHVSGILPAAMVEGGGAGLMDLGDLQDVDLSGLADGYSIFYDTYTDTWFAAPGGSGGPINMGDLSDVNLAGLGNGEVLAWNATLSQWEPTEMSGGGGSGAAGSMDIDLSGETPGTIEVDLSSVPSTVSTVIVEGPDGGDNMFEITDMPNPATRGPLTIICWGGEGYVQWIDAGWADHLAYGKGINKIVAYPFDTSWTVVPDKFAPGAHGYRVYDMSSETPVGGVIEIDLTNLAPNVSGVRLIANHAEEITFQLILPNAMNRGPLTVMAVNNSGTEHVRISGSIFGPGGGSTSPLPVVLVNYFPLDSWVGLEVGPYASINLSMLLGAMSSYINRSWSKPVTANETVPFGLTELIVGVNSAQPIFSVNSGADLTFEPYTGPVTEEEGIWVEAKMVHTYQWGTGGGDIIFDGLTIIWDGGTPPVWSSPGECDLVEYVSVGGSNSVWYGRVLAQGVVL